jgi:hypothetical protein
MQIFQTRNREAAARVLSGRYERVMIRNKNMLWNPLRLQRAKLADLNPYIVMNPPEFDAQLEAWNRNGGMLIYDRTFSRYENVGGHEAQLVSECPISISELENWIEGASTAAVIYNPPNWTEHRRYIDNIHPSAERCAKLYETICAAPPNDDVGALFGLPSGSSHVLAEGDTSAVMGLNTAQLKCLRKSMFHRGHYKAVWRATLRVEPDDDTLARAYQFIERECPCVGGVHLITGATLARHVRFWKMALRHLERRGAIGLKDILYCYNLDRFSPHWERMDARRRVAEGRLTQMIKRLDGARELSLPKTHSPQSRFRPRQSLLSSAA